MTDERPLGSPHAQVARQPGVRALFVEPRLYEDGGARATLQLVREWTREQVPVVLFVLQRAEPTNAAPVPPDVDVTYATRRDLRLRSVLPWALLRVVPLARRADVVLSSRDVGWGLLLGRVGAWLARRPYVVIIRSAPQEAIRRWVSPRLHAATRQVYRSADRVVCIAPELVPAVVELGVRPDRTVVVLEGMDVDRILEAGRAVPPDLPDGPGPLLVGVGRLDHQKGFDVLIRASAQVLAAGHPHRLLILGEGRDRAQLEELVAELGVADSVQLPGFAPQPLSVVAAADLFCLPSRYEGLPQSLMEALILGVPSVAADCVSGPRLLLADGAYGDLVPVEDVDALAESIQRHLQDPQRLRTAAQRGQAWALEHLRLERAAGQLLDVLHDVTTRAGASA